MGDKGMVWLPDGASTLAPEIDALFFFVYWVSVILFVGVVGTMVFFAYRYRRRSETDRPAPIKENKFVEASWVVLPTFLVLIVFTWGFKAFLKLGTPPPNAYEITVRAQKWNWQFEYPNGASSNELHVPVGRPVKLRMSSVDVLHSFFVPAFRVKQDVIPNRYTYVWFEATKQDTFLVACTEYCGTRHSDMLTQVVVHSQDDFNTWLAESRMGADASPAERGALLFGQLGCKGCHSLDGTPGVGPTIQGLFGTQQRPLSDGSSVVADDNYIRESILNPAAKIAAGSPPAMPAAYGGLSAEELDALIAFIKEQ
ncbi:MAG: cytochrome c oxidase subunit II [Rhodothermales bacterium]